MRFTEPCSRGAAAWALAGLLAGCGVLPPPSGPAPAPPPVTPPAPVPPPPPATVPAPAVVVEPPSAPASPRPPNTPAATPQPVAPTTPKAQAGRPARRTVALGPPATARTWDEFRLQAATRLVKAHPDGSYVGPVPEPLLAIPVLEVELNADGSVRRVSVARQPSQARDTVQLAIDAVHRAAPFGSMARLPLPWKWTAVFLFDDERRFKPHELDRR